MQQTCLLLIFSLFKKNLHEVISPGHENMRKVADTGENENYRELHLDGLAESNLLCWKMDSKSAHLNCSCIRSVSLLS